MLSALRLAVTPQVARLLEVSEAAALARLRRLGRRGLIGRSAVFNGQPAAAWITASGLRALGHRLPPGGVELDTHSHYRHEVGVAWLWLAAHGGGFGALTSLATDREMRTHDARLAQGERPLGIGIGTFDWRGRPSRHYPDLLLGGSGGERLAVELELTRKSDRRLEQIMRGYATDSRICGVLYIVSDRALGGVIDAAAVRAGLTELVRVTQLRGGVPGALPPHALNSAGVTRAMVAQR